MAVIAHGDEAVVVQDFKAREAAERRIGRGQVESAAKPQTTEARLAECNGPRLNLNRAPLLRDRGVRRRRRARGEERKARKQKAKSHAGAGVRRRTGRGATASPP